MRKRMLLAILLSFTIHAQGAETTPPPGDAKGWYEQGCEHQQQGRFREAAEAFRRAIQLGRADFDTHLRLARSFLALDQPWDAYPAANLAVSAAPDSAEARKVLGEVRSRIALLENRKASPAASPGPPLVLTPAEQAEDNHLAHATRAGALAQDGKLEEAIREWERAVAQLPHADAYRIALGFTLFRAGHLDRALDEGKKAAEMNPTAAQAHRVMALAHAGRGEREEALESALEAARLMPQDPQIATDLATLQADPKLDWSRVAQLRNEGRQYDRALEAARKAIERDPKSYMGHHETAIALKRKGDYSKSIEWFQKAIAIDPKEAPAYGNLAGSYIRTGDAASAIPWARQGVERDPASGALRNQLGLALLENKEPAKAIEHFQKALELGPPNVMMYANLAQAYLDTGRFREAAEAARSALKLDPDFEDMKQVLRKAEAAPGR